MALKLIFQLESIPWVYLHDILKRLLAKVCFDALFTCLFRFVAFSVTFTYYDVERHVVVTVTPTIKGNGPKLADWSKSICITL